jgi:IS30 family transposase
MARDIPLMEMGRGIGETARRLRHHRATIHREIGHNRRDAGDSPGSAERRAGA